MHVRVHVCLCERALEMGGELIPRSPCAEDDLTSFQNSTKHLTSFLLLALKRKKKSFLRNPIIQQRLSPETWIILILKVVPPSKHSFSYYSFFWWLFDMNKTLSSLLNTCMFGAGIVKVLGWIYFWICKQGSSELPLLAGERMPLPGEPWFCSSVANNLVRS